MTEKVEMSPAPARWILPGTAAAALLVGLLPHAPSGAGEPRTGAIRAIAIQPPCDAACLVLSEDPENETWPDAGAQAALARAHSTHGREASWSTQGPASEAACQAKQVVLVAPKTGPPA